MTQDTFSPPPQSLVRLLVRWCTPRPTVSRAVRTALIIHLLVLGSVLAAALSLPAWHVAIPALLIVSATLWMFVLVNSYTSSIESSASHTHIMLTSDFPQSLVGACILFVMVLRWLLIPSLLVLFAVALAYSPTLALIAAMAGLLASSALRMLGT
jgi:hypothetical protein